MHKTIALLFVLTIACQPKAKKESESESSVTTDSKIELINLKDEKIKLSSEITILNLWATWCKPCIAEMPDLDEMQKQLPEGFQLFLASNEPLDRQLRFIEKQQSNLEFIQITSNLEALGVYALPTTLILDAEGNILETLVGSRAWNTPKQIKHITSYLK